MVAAVALPLGAATDLNDCGCAVVEVALPLGVVEAIGLDDVVVFVLLLGEVRGVTVESGFSAVFVSIVTPFKKKSVLLGLLSFNGGRLVVWFTIHLHLSVP